MPRPRVPGLLLVTAVLLLAGCVKSPPEGPAAEVEAAEERAPGGTEGVVHSPSPVASTAPPGAEGSAGLASGALPSRRPPAAEGGLYSIGAESTEPTLGIDAEGNLYVTAIVRGPGHVLMKTSDKGQTFEPVFPALPDGRSAHLSSFDPYMLVDRATGRVFMDDIWPLGCGHLSFSDDQGATWTTNPASCGNPQVNDHQTVGVGKPRRLPTVGYPNLVYRCVNNILYTGCAVSPNGGLTFLPQVPVVGLAIPCSAQTGHLASDPEGRMFLATTVCTGGPHVGVTEDDGLTWKAYPIDPRAPNEEFEHDVELASDEAGNLYAVWTHRGQVVLSRSVDHGATWTPARNVTAPGVTATMFAAVAAAGPGKIAFAYVGTTIPGGYEGKPGGVGGLGGDLVGEPDPPEWAAATWNAYVGIVTDALADDFTIETVTANDPADPLARGLCGRTRCHGMNDFLDVEIDPEGRPWAAFVDVCTKACVTDPKVHWDEAVGAVGTLVRGPSLLAGGGALEPLAPPPGDAGTG